MSVTKSHNPQKSADIKLAIIADKTSQKKTLQASIKDEVDELDREMNILEAELLVLATENRADWFPKKKTLKLKHGDLVFRTSNRLVNNSDLDAVDEPKPVDENNTDLLRLAKNSKTRKLVRLTPVLSEFQKYIKDHGALPEGFEDVEIVDNETFGAKAYPLKEEQSFWSKVKTSWSYLFS